MFDSVVFFGGITKGFQGSDGYVIKHAKLLGFVKIRL